MYLPVVVVVTAAFAAAAVDDVVIVIVIIVFVVVFVRVSELVCIACQPFAHLSGIKPSTQRLV